MTYEQLLAFSVLIIMMVVLILDRFRYDLVAVCTLLVSVILGLVSPADAFSGFSNDIVIIVGCALLVSAGVARSGIMETLIQRLWPHTKSIRLQLAFLVITVTLLSAFVKNIGALAIMLPVAFQFARRSKTSPSVFLMPMAFGALLGGLMTQIGTSPNVVVSQMREKLVGQPFSMFDYTPVGAAVALVGVIYLVLFYRLVPVRHRSRPSRTELMEQRAYITEAAIPAGSTIIGKTIADLMRPAARRAMALKIIRNKKPLSPLPDTVIAEHDVVVLEGSPKALDAVVNTARLDVSTGRTFSNDNSEKASPLDTVEAVITDHSPLIGITARQLALFDRYDVNLLAISRQSERLRQRPSDIAFRLGDIIVLQGRENVIPDMLNTLRCLPLERRHIMLGNLRRALLPLFILVAAILATVFHIAPVAIAFFAAATAMAVFHIIPGREIYQALDGQILVMLAALIPISEALEKTGCTVLIANWLSQSTGMLPPSGTLTLMLIAAMLVTPFLNNAATVMVMAPIASSFAATLHYKPEAFLMAVAIGAGCDFLTPIGHQCNMLVMGPGGYHFSDYPRLGLPLAILIVLVSVPVLMVVWPLT